MCTKNSYKGVKMINKAVAEIGYIKDKHFKNKSLQFLLAIIMYVIFFVIVGAYLIFRIFFFVDSNKDIVEFKKFNKPKYGWIILEC